MKRVTNTRKLKILLAGAIFFGAFLLFLVQPMVARVILPKFGGAASVWTVCMLFFQSVLLGGYLIAHLIATRSNFRLQSGVFILLAVGAVVLLRPHALLSSTNSPDSSPETQILFLLLLSIGGPYALLSSVSPLLQRWTSTLEDSQGFYRLYALSNLGSLLALLLYPLCVERLLGAQAQLTLWALGFVTEVILLIGCALLIGRAEKSGHAVVENLTVERSSSKELISWWTLSFLGSVILISFTNFITSDVAPVPLLWVFPLALYLITFIIVFEREHPIRPEPLFLLTYGLILGVGDKIVTGAHAHMIVSGGFLLVTLFCACLVCHTELGRLRPPRERLTTFYLTLAFGGCSGGIFVGLIAPRVFSGFWEFPLVLIAVLAVIGWNGRDLLKKHVVALQARGATVLSTILFLLGVLVIARALFVDPKRPIDRARNFYGVLKIVDMPNKDPDLARRAMYHGRINHGTQLMAPDRALTATAYFGEGSGAWIATQFHRPEHARKIGIIGLGAGVIASHGKSGDTIEYYEINPLVEKFARQYFTFLSQSPATVSVQVGDGRLLLEQSAPKNLDLMILDAFSGDAIPSHLLTREAFVEYFRHLKEDGLLVLHISNHHLDLEPVAWSIARELKLYAAFFDHRETPKPYLSHSYYMIVARSPEFFQRPEVSSRIERAAPVRALPRPWTDDWIDMIGVIRFGGE